MTRCVLTGGVGPPLVFDFTPPLGEELSLRVERAGWSP